MVDEGVGVRAVVRVDAVLEGYRVGLRHVREPPEQATVVVDTRVLVDERRATAETRRVLLLLHRRHIADEADIERDGEIESMRMRHRLRAVQPAFLLHGRAEPEIVVERGGIEVVEQEIHDREEHPVVHRLAAIRVPNAARATTR